MPSDDLRTCLREATREAHDRLDAALAPHALGGDYGRFLAVQHAARSVVEPWLARHAPAGWCPPRQLPLLAADLASTGAALAAQTPPFAAPAAGFWGAAWAVAGSSLGNRAMLAQRRKRGLHGGDSFLADPAMPAYWQRLRPQLETRPGRDPAAVAAALAVFAAFAAVAPFDTHTKDAA